MRPVSWTKRRLKLPSLPPKCEFPAFLKLWRMRIPCQSKCRPPSISRATRGILSLLNRPINSIIEMEMNEYRASVLQLFPMNEMD